MIMPPLNDLYMTWDERGGYWYSPNGTQITPKEMMEYARQLEIKNERLQPLAEYGLAAYQNIRLIFFDDAADVMRRIDDLRGE